VLSDLYLTRFVVRKKNEEKKSRKNRVLCDFKLYLTRFVLTKYLLIDTFFIFF